MKSPASSFKSASDLLQKTDVNYNSSIPIWTLILSQELFSEPYCAAILDSIIRDKYDGERNSTIDLIIDALRRNER